MYKVGQWYQYKDYPRQFRKCSREDSNRICFLEKINETKYFKDADWSNRPFSEGSCIPVDISVIAEYLPKDHPDLLKLNTVIELW